MSFKKIIFFCNPVYAGGYDVFGIGFYDVKFDGSEEQPATDFRYERRFDKILLDIGPKEDNLGQLFTGDKSNFIFTPSFGAGYYNDGDGKKLGHELEFRTTFEISYELKNKNRIGFSFGHISNAKIGDKNPGAEIASFS